MTLLIRNGRVLDPAAGVDEVQDLLITEGRIARTGKGLTAPAGARTVTFVLHRRLFRYPDTRTIVGRGRDDRRDDDRKLLSLEGRFRFGFRRILNFGNRLGRPALRDGTADGMMALPHRFGRWRFLQ